MAASRATSHRQSSTWVELAHRVDAWSSATEKWWKSLLARERIALAIAVVFAAAGTLNLIASAFVPRTTTPIPTTTAVVQTSTVVPSVMRESPPADAGKAWNVVSVWNGSASRELDKFTVGDHWRLDWLFSPVAANPQLQVYVYAVDGRQLLTLAANTSNAGPDSSFWLGAGTYFLRVNALGGDWKVAIQDLR